MASACGIGYEEAIQDSIIRTVDGVAIPFASASLLWRMKENTHRVKDHADLLFLRQQYSDESDECYFGLERVSFSSGYFSSRVSICFVISALVPMTIQ